MFKGQPRKPEFQVGDLVHLRWTSQNPSAIVKEAGEIPGSTEAASIEKPRPFQFPPRERATEYKISDIAANAALKDLTRPELVWRIEASQPSMTDQREHTYTLVPAQPLRLKTAESSLVKAPFQLGDVVVAKKDTDRLLSIEQLMLYEHGIKVEVVDEISIREWFWASELEKAPIPAAWRPM